MRSQLAVLWFAAVGSFGSVLVQSATFSSMSNGVRHSELLAEGNGVSSGVAATAISSSSAAGAQALPIGNAISLTPDFSMPSGAESFASGGGVVQPVASSAASGGDVEAAAMMPDLAPAIFSGFSGAIVVSTVPGTMVHNVPVNQGDNVFVDAGFANFGDVEVPANTATVRLLVDSSEVFSGLFPNPMAAGGGGGLLSDVALGALTPGAHTIELIVDSLNAVTESDETNNSLTRTVNVAATGTAPDLQPALFTGWSDSLVISTVSGTNTDAGSVSSADTVFVDLGVANFGNAIIDASTFVYTLSVDGSVVHTVNTGFQLAAGGGGSVSQDVNIGMLTAGSHTLRLDVDANSSVVESNESNNFRERMITVVAPSTVDFGDAPTATQTGFASSYPTTLADNGARHTVVSGFSLGTNVDTDNDGTPSLGAVGDDTSGTPDDEDGVVFDAVYFNGETTNLDVNVVNTAMVTNPHLDVWVDFNRDGDWGDVGEAVFSGAVTAGSNLVPLAVPSGALPGLTYARLRLHDGVSGLAVTGAVASGEVEDHTLVLASRGVWVEQGAAPVQNGQLEPGTAPNQQVNGAVHTVLAHPTNADILYIGAVNGGVWKTSDASSTNPTWTPQTDSLGSLSMGAMAFDSSDATSNTLVAGTALYSSFAGTGGTRGAVYRTTDGGANWVDPGSAGLAGENISGIAARGNTIVVTSSANGGGIFRSTDGGANFGVIADEDFLDNDNFTDLVEDLSDGSNMRLYAAGEGLGIYRSDDFGATWTKITSVAINSGMNSLIVDATSNNTEMAVHPTTGRLYVALLLSGQPRAVYHTDNGTNASPTWTEMDVPILPFNLSGGTAITDASNASPIAITSAGHGLSTAHFVVIDGVVGNTAANGFFRITVTGTDTFTLDGSTGNGAYTSGGTWTRVTGPNPRAKLIDEAGAQGRIHFSIQVDPTNHNIIYMGGDRQDQPSVIGDSTFGGAIFRGDASIAANPAVVPSPQWDHITHDQVAFDAPGGTANGTAPHADSREMVFDAAGNLIEVDDGGVFKRTNPRNNTGDWFSLAGNLGVAEYHDIAYDSLSNVVMSGSQDNGTQIQQTGGSRFWTLISGGDGGDAGVDVSSLAGMSQSIRYSSFQNMASFRRSVFDHNNVLVSQTFPALTLTGGGSALQVRFKTPVELNAAAPSRMLIIGSNSVYESMDQGATIVEIGAGIGVGNVLEDAVAYGTSGNPDAIYVGLGDNVFVRTTGGGALAMSATYPGAGSGDAVRDVVMNPGDATEAFVIDSNQVFRTQNSGGTWTEISGNIASLAGQALRSIVFLPGSTGAVAIGADLGVFTARLPDLGGSTTWTEVGSNLPNAVVFDLIYNAADDVLLAGTMGRGAWTMHAAAASLAGADIRGRFAFYNNTAWDMNSALASADDDSAVATDVMPLLPGGTAGVANYTAYEHGLTGVMVDILGLGGTPTAADFEFKTGNDSNPSAWTAPPAPVQVTKRDGVGVDGADRISIIWSDNNLDTTVDANEAVAGQWLEVTVKANGNTGLATPDVFYFGNAPGEVGDNPGTDANVVITDIFTVFGNQAANVDILNDFDHNRDKAVNITDLFISFNNQVSGSSALQMINLSGGGAPGFFESGAEPPRFMDADAFAALLAGDPTGGMAGETTEGGDMELGFSRLEADGLPGLRFRLHRPDGVGVLYHAPAIDSEEWTPVPEGWLYPVEPGVVEVTVPDAEIGEQRFFRLEVEN